MNIIFNVQQSEDVHLCQVDNWLFTDVGMMMMQTGMVKGGSAYHSYLDGTPLSKRSKNKKKKQYLPIRLNLFLNR